MKLLSNFPQMLIASLLLSLFTQIIPLSSTLIISSKIDYNGVTTVAPVESVLCVPPGAYLTLNCTSSPGVQWLSDSEKYPVILPHNAGALAIISSFSDANSGLYSCSLNGEEAVVNVTTLAVASVAIPQDYDVYGESSVTLFVCVSAYPTLQSGLVMQWSNESRDISSCSSQGAIGCFECEVPVGSSYSEQTVSFQATSQSYISSQALTVTVHEVNIVSPLATTTDVVECGSGTLSCTATGDPDLGVEWRYKSNAISSSGDFTITTSRSYNPEEGLHYTYSTLVIKLVGGDSGGEYSCLFYAHERENNVTSMTQVQVVPQLCIRQHVSNTEHRTVTGNSVILLQENKQYVYVCIGLDVRWYQGDDLVSEDINSDIYQVAISGLQTLSLIITPDPSFFYCRSEQPFLETWLYFTTTHPTVITIPSGFLYSIRGSNLTINAYLSPTQDSYTLSWSYNQNGTLRDVTELGWTNEQNSISLTNIDDIHSGDIQVDYNTGGLVSTTSVSIMTLTTPDLQLDYPSHLYLWEGSSLQVECSLLIENMPVTISPEWEGVPDCPSEVCSDNSSLSLTNLTEATEGRYTCTAGNQVGLKQISLNIEVMPFSDDLISLSYQLSESASDRADTLTLTASNSSVSYLRLSCSLNNSVFSTDYLPVTELTWTYNSSLAADITKPDKTSLSIDVSAVFSKNQGSQISSELCCQSTLDIYRVAQQCINVRFNADIVYPPPTPTPTPSHISILMLVDDCTLLPSPDILTSVKLSLLDLIRTNCSCNVSDTELNLTEKHCHMDYLSNQPYALLTLCGASTHSIYSLLLNASLNKEHIYIGGHDILISSVKSEYEGTHCYTHTTNSTLKPTSANSLPVWSKIVLFGALPMMVFMLVLLFVSIFCYLCWSNLSKPSKKDDYTIQVNLTGGQKELTESDNPLEHSGELLTSSLTLSPSLVPQTFKSATNPMYQPQLSSPLELLARPASTPPQGEFPVMYSNPLAFEGSGEGYSTSFSNFNNNHTFYSDMPPISETAQRMPPVFATHRLQLHQNYPYFARDHAHSSLPSPLRSARRHHHMQQRLPQQRNRSVTPTGGFMHHQLKLSHSRPPSTMRTETPTFDSGVEEMESINPRSSSSASSQASEEVAAPRVRSTSLATAFPQHILHSRVHSIELVRNTSLPNIADVSAGQFNSHGLELYKTVKSNQRASQTLV